MAAGRSAGETRTAVSDPVASPPRIAARAFDAAIAELAPAARRADTARHGRNVGVYPYSTASGTRWRGSCTGAPTEPRRPKRGFASERAARDARRRLIEQVERGEVRRTKETFGGY